MTNRLRLQNVILPPPDVVIYDIEVTANTFMYSDVDRDTDQIRTFVIHPNCNQGDELIEYLKTLKGQIGFNNRKFDSQVQQYLINNWDWLQFRSALNIAQSIYDYAQKIIARQDTFDKFKLDYPDHEISIPQLDLFLIHHFDNVAKKQSLKGVQCNLNYWNVQDMPFDHKQHLTYDQLQELIEYNKNDILATKFLYQHSLKQIDLRKDLQKLYNIRCLNWSDSKIGEELVFRFYCEYTEQDFKEVRQQRTKRDEIKLKNCILPNISFKTKEFNSIKKRLGDIVIYNGETKKQQKIITKYHGLEIEYGNGGIHASLQGIFEENEEYMIYDVDVTSLYPSIAISNNFYPEHLGPEFITVYKEKIVDRRIEEKNKKEKGNKAIVLALKNAANSVYGKSNSRYSFLYDPLYTLNTTITGQLQISMLAESIKETIGSDVFIIQMNTDGITFYLKRDREQQFLEICKNWEQLTKLSLEYVTYKKMYIRDVNNYIAVKKDEVKLKGCFEKDYHKPENFHKDNSFRIVPLALEKYVVHGIPVEQTIKNHDKIWDFLGRIKLQSNMNGVLSSFRNGKLNRRVTSNHKVTRYFVSNDGESFQKIIKDEDFELDVNNIEDNLTKIRISSLEKGFRVTEANIIKDENAKNYNINYRYYVKECEKIIDAVESEFSKINGKKKKIRHRTQTKLDF